MCLGVFDEMCLRFHSLEIDQYYFFLNSLYIHYDHVAYSLGCITLSEFSYSARIWLQFRWLALACSFFAGLSSSGAQLGQQKKKNLKIYLHAFILMLRSGISWPESSSFLVAW